MNDHSTKRKIIEVTNAEEPTNTKKQKIENEGDESVDRDAVFASLPLEILGQHILKFFDFIKWLKLVIVCKQWLLAAQQSHLPKQFIFDKSISDAKPNLEFACTILRKYNVNTLVIVQEQEKTMLFSQLQTLLNSSRAITTLVLDQCYPFQDDVSVNFEQIRTLSTTKTWILPHFPQVEKLKLSTHEALKDGLLYDAGSKKNIDSQIFPSVKEIELNVLSSLGFDFANFTKYFPNVVKMYINYDIQHNTKQQVEEGWKRLEEIGDTLGVQVICRNPHLSERSDVFNLTSITYHEYFNAFGETPLQKFLSYTDNHPKKCQELFVSYSSRQYEKDLLHHEPQFTFPLRGPAFNPYCMKACIESDKIRLAMVECGYMDYWKALGQLRLKNAMQLLRTSSQHTPPTKNAIESILKLIGPDLSAVTIADMIGLEAFKEIVKMTTKDGSTLLLKVAGKVSDLDLIIEHSDVHVLNKEGMNAATIAFNHAHFSSWLKLLNAGCQVQSKLYQLSILSFLRELVVSESNDQIHQVLKQFDQSLLHKLMRLLVGQEAVDYIYPRTNSLAVLEELINLGARPHDYDDNQNPLISLMAESKQIKSFWPIIEKYHLDINEASRDGYTPLMISVFYDHYEQADFLLEEGADPNASRTSPDGEIQCLQFMKEVIGQPTYINLLQTYGADWTVEDEQGNTVLNYAILHYNSACIKKLAKLVPIDKPNQNNCTPLFNAICEQKLNFIKDLIDAGADVNALTGPLLQPALMTAIELSSEEVILLLLKKTKHDITIRDRVGRSIVHYLLLTRGTKKLACLGDDDLELHGYKTPEHISFVKNELTAIFATPELEHLKGQLLSIAIRSLPTTSTLVDVLGMDVNMEDSNGNTMLHLLNAEKGTDELIDYLLSKPSLNLNHQNKQKNTPLMIMTEKKKTDADFGSWQLKLIEAGASLTIKNMWGLAPIDIEPSLKKYVKELNK